MAKLEGIATGLAKKRIRGAFRNPFGGGGHGGGSAAGRLQAGKNMVASFKNRGKGGQGGVGARSLMAKRKVM